MSAKTAVLGFGGITCGGKTTLSELIGSALGERRRCFVFHQDDYYWPIDDPYWRNDGTDNWEEIPAFDMDKMLRQVKEKIMSVGVDDVIIIEGILIYEDERLDQLMTHRYFFTLPYEECRARRSLRIYVPPEPYPEYFDVVYWPVYQKQLVETAQRSDTKCIDSTQPLDAMRDAIFAHLSRQQDISKSS